MRKYFSERSRLISGIAILLFAILPGCEKDFDEIIDVNSDNFQLRRIDGIKDTVDLKNPSDSLLNLRVIFNTGSEVSKVYFEIQASDDNIIVSSEMIPAGVDTFENVFIFRSNYPIGNYKIRFSASGFNGVRKQVAVANFYFNNGQDNVAPLVSNSIIEPDTVVVNTPTTIFTSIEADDLNGANDIAEVYFIVYRPDSTTNGNKISMHDDGSCCPIPPTTQTSGDVTENDGIFSRIIIVDQSNMKGLYRFEFQAKDRSGFLSNIINHFVLIQ